MKVATHLWSISLLFQISQALYIPFDLDNLKSKVIDQVSTLNSNIGEGRLSDNPEVIHKNEQINYDTIMQKFSLYQPLKHETTTKATTERLHLNENGGLKPKTAIPRNDFEEWLSVQNDIAFESILKNIGGYGDFDSKDNVSLGAVIASPSKNHPNYFYQWVRDAAITINSLTEYLDDHEFDDSKYNLTFLIESYIVNNANLQKLDNPSGTSDPNDLSGLGEPKFMVDSTPFTDNWGRPQRDGPGLRAISIINYLNLLIKYDQNITNTDELHSFQYVYENIIKPDLQYVIKYWNANGFDLWEEINSMHLFTSITQLKAIKLGLEFAVYLDEQDTEFIKNLKNCFNALRYYILVDSGYRNPSLPYLIETPSLLASNRRSGLDIATILGVLRAHDIDNVEDSNDIPFNLDDTSVLNTLNAMMNDMKYRYPINHGKLGFGTGFGLGRYPEDIYDGYGTSEGNPWFISTATASELLYKMIYKLYKFKNDLVIPIEHKSFYKSFISNLELDSQETVVPYGSKSFEEMTSAILSFADSFLDIIREHVDNDGHMSEQFNRYSGYMEGAQDLTWSYGSFWSSLRWRQKVLELIN